MNVNTFSGDVTLRLPASARGDITFDSFSGSFNSDLPVTLSSSSKRNFRGSLNGGGSTDSAEDVQRRRDDSSDDVHASEAQRHGESMALEQDVKRLSLCRLCL